MNHTLTENQQSLVNRFGPYAFRTALEAEAHQLFDKALTMPDTNARVMVASVFRAMPIRAFTAGRVHDITVALNDTNHRPAATKEALDSLVRDGALRRCRKQGKTLYEVAFTL